MNVSRSQDVVVVNNEGVIPTRTKQLILKFVLFSYQCCQTYGIAQNIRQFDVGAGSSTISTLLRQLKHSKYDGRDLEKRVANFDHLAAQLALMEHPIPSTQLGTLS